MSTTLMSTTRSTPDARGPFTNGSFCRHLLSLFTILIFILLLLVPCITCMQCSPRHVVSCRCVSGTTALVTMWPLSQQIPADHLLLHMDYLHQQVGVMLCNQYNHSVGSVVNSMHMSEPLSHAKNQVRVQACTSPCEHACHASTCHQVAFVRPSPGKA